MDLQPAQRPRYFLWFLFLVSAGVAIGFFFVPAFIIRPFTHQSPAGLAAAMALRQRAPWATLVAALVCLPLACILWRGASVWRGANVWRRVALVAIMVPVLFSTVMARVNYFLFMFHPVDAPQFETAEASRLDSGDMVMAVRFGGDARAYPISEMAYHHIVNDVVGDSPGLATPIVVTY